MSSSDQGAPEAREWGGGADPQTAASPLPYTTLQLLDL